MSIRSKKQKRWAKRIEEMTKKRDRELEAWKEWTRNTVAHEMKRSNFEQEVIETIATQRVDELIIHSPEWMIFREKRESKKARRG